MALDSGQLNAIDNWILDYIHGHKRATPNLLRRLYNDGTESDVSRQWVSRRVNRLAEHDHLRQVHPDASVYEFVNDPR